MMHHEINEKIFDSDIFFDGSMDIYKMGKRLKCSAHNTKLSIIHRVK